jgi:predicted phage baseplate assembly protein
VSDDGDRKPRCCEPGDALIRHNPPGLPAIEYRLRSWSESLEHMIAELPRARPASGRNRDTRPLAQLRTRASDDPTIAVIDAWARVMDVMCFYQERIANEGFLRTATERASVLELARMIGYELDPGVAASAMLCVRVIEASDAPATVEIPRGLPVMSVPGPGERPQTFEVASDFVARREWNELELRQRTAQLLVGGVEQVWVAPGSRIEVGAGVLAVAGSTWDFALVTGVDGTAASGRIRLTLGPGKAGQFWASPSVEPDSLVLLGRTARAFGHRAPGWQTMHRAARADLLKLVYNPDSLPDHELGSDWPGFALTEGALALEGEHRQVIPGSWFVVSSDASAAAARVVAVAVRSRAEFGVTSATTELSFSAANGPVVANRSRRDVLVYLEDARLELIDAPMLASTNTELELSAAHASISALAPEQPLIVSGRDQAGQAQVELVRVRSFEVADGHPIIGLTTALTSDFVASSVRILANVVLATHGETIPTEVLGSGDAATGFQQFMLRKAPLTHVGAATASGALSSLEIRVGGVSWSRLDTLFGQPAEREGYVERLADDGTVTVQFGDGVTGARIPTGVENVVARYRVGLGEPGMVRANSLRLAKLKPAGLESLNNPLAAEGGQDPERLADARRNAPTTVSTLDRLVSVSDFEDFARSFSGITKARAVELWDMEQRFVLVTVAGTSGLPVSSTSELGRNLLAAIATIADPTQTVRLGGFEQLRFEIEIEVGVDPRHVRGDVHAAVAAALRSAFAFEHRSFAQPVSAAEVMSVAHEVAGVIAVDLDDLHIVGSAIAATGSPATLLPARDARIVGAALEPAQLLLIAEGLDAVRILEMNE